MKVTNRSSQFFLKYLLSYVVILLVPVFIIGALVNIYFMNVLKEEVTSGTLKTLNKSKYVIDGQISQLESIYYQIFNVNHNLRSFFHMEDSPIKDIRIRDELYNYTAANLFINEVALFLRDDNYIYTSKGAYPVEMFTNSIYAYRNWPIEDFYKDIVGTTKAIVRPAEDVNDNERYITFTYPFSPNAVNPSSALLFLIKERSVQELLENNINNDDGNSMIVDKDNRIITMIKDDEYVRSEEFREQVKSMKDKEVKDVKLNGKKFLIFVTSSDKMNWKYVTILPFDKVMGQVFNLQLIFICCIFTVTILGSMFIFLSMNLNYKPVKQLKLYTEKILKSNDSKALNELDSVRKAIEFLSSENGELNSKIKNNYSAVKDSLIFSLLKGKINNLDEFNKIGKELGMGFTKKFFRIIIIKTHIQNKSSFDKGSIINLIENSMPKEIECYGRDHLDSDKYVLVVSAEEDKEDIICEKLLSFQNSISEKLGLVITIGVGNSCTELSYAPRSYMEASTALKHRFIKGNGKIILFNEITINQHMFKGYPKEKVDNLKGLIKDGNIIGIESVLEFITSFIKEKDSPLFIARGICFDIINIVSHTDEETDSEFVVIKEKYPDIFLLETMETVEEFIKIIKDICEDICSNIQRRSAKNALNLIDEIICYINQNYDNCNLSIQEIANHFGMNMSYLSQYFKAQTNQTVLDYITDLRMQKARELLASSKLSLKYVAEEIGYYNVSSFIRRFKQITGITPGEYRESQVNQGV